MVLRFVFNVFLATAFVGCSVVHDARQAQRDVRPKASDCGESAPLPTPPDGRSLAALVDFALESRPSVASARLAVVDARLALKQVAADAPVVSATPWNAAHASASAGHSEATTPAHLDDFKLSTKGDPSASISVDLLLYDFGRNAALAQSRAEDVIAAETSLVKEEYAVFKEVSDAYFGLHESRALLEVAQTNEYVRALHLDQVERMLSEGEAKRLDVLRAKLDLASARERLVAASNDVSTAFAEYFRALGAAEGGRGDEAEGALASARRGFADTEYDAAEACALARTNAPSMRIARARLRAAVADVDAAVADLYPEVSFSASLSWTDPLWVFKWGFSAAERLFTGWRRTAAVERAVVAMKKASAAVDAAEQDLVRDIEIAVAARDNAREARKAADESLASARENLSTVTEQYKVGDASRVDFADAVDNYASALGSRVGAFYRGQRAEAALFALLGSSPVYDERTSSLENQ